jgi:hypothetical protein
MRDNGERRMKFEYAALMALALLALWQIGGFVWRSLSWLL